MQILFFMAHPGFTRNYESTLRELADRGHTIEVLFDRAKLTLPGQYELIGRLAREYPRLTYGHVPWRREVSPYARASYVMRVAIDYTRYLEPVFSGSPKLRARVASYTPSAVRALLARPPFTAPQGRERFRRIMLALDRCVPVPDAITAFLEERRPDVVLVTPLLEIGTPQLDYVRASRSLGIQTALCVASWDNLTTKGLIQELPDLVTVWNDAQVQEAVELHGVPEDRVVATGAVAYDHWFSWEPSTTRTEFCERVRLMADRPIVLYVCSSGFIAQDETGYIIRWIEELRTRLPQDVRDVGILVRPHPTQPLRNPGRIEDLDQVSIWPAAGANPTDRRSRDDYYDSIYHSQAVVGINTSALIESAIVGRPVLTVLSDETHGTQEGTLHFHHLLRENGGPLSVAETFTEHVRDLSDHLRELPSNRSEQPAARFLREFVRPFGLGTPAAPRMADAIEGLAERAAPPMPRAPRLAVLARPWIIVAGLIVLFKDLRASRRSLWGQILSFMLRRPRVRAIARNRVRPLLQNTAKRIANATAQVSSPPPPTQVHGAEERLLRLSDLAPHAVLDELASSRDPIIAGPWTDSVLSEICEWIPFLAWLVDREPSVRSRLTVVTAGSPTTWYRSTGLRCVDLQEMVSVPKSLVDRRLASTGRTTPRTLDDLAREELIPVIRSHLGEPEARAILPDGECMVERVASWSTPTAPPDGRMGNQYIRFVANDVLALTRENVRLLAGIVAHMAARDRVVVLRDDFGVVSQVLHDDPSLSDRLDQSPYADLGELTNRLGSASALVGTLDGSIALAGRMGVRAVGVIGSLDQVEPYTVDALGRLGDTAPGVIDAVSASLLLSPRTIPRVAAVSDV